jgi:hypothetical protein
LSTLFKVAVILMLLVLLIGPMLQTHDCFNDAPNLDQDAILHTVDALLCIAFSLMFSCFLIWAFAIVRFSGNLQEQLQCWFFGPASDRPTPPLSPQFLSLRI